MHIEFIFSLIFSIIVVPFVNGNKGTDASDSRFLIYNGSFSFTTFTVLKASTTITSVLTSTTTCTTSSATLTTCTIGRRRRGLFYDEAASQGHNRRGLFYNDEEIDNKESGVFLPAAIKSSVNPVDEIQSKPSDNSSAVPLIVESGYELPKDSPVNRFLVSFGTSTLTSYTVTTSTVSLTAFCSSTTGFALCGTIGK